MKKIKPRTWIAFGCVALAIAASQTYNALKEKEPPEEEVAVISEILPSPPTPVATPSVKITPSPVSDHPEVTISAEKATVPVNAPAENEAKTELPEFMLPATGEMQQSYSDTTLVRFDALGEWRCHLGIDFLPSENNAVFAAADGIVEKVYEDHLYGTTIVIDHGNGLKTLYGSLTSIAVEAGAAVTGGMEIGTMGETAAAEPGVHLHFSMEKDGTPIDPFGEK